MTDTRSQDTQSLPRRDSLGFDRRQSGSLRTDTASNASSVESASVGSGKGSPFTARFPLHSKNRTASSIPKDDNRCVSAETTAETVPINEVAPIASDAGAVILNATKSSMLDLSGESFEQDERQMPHKNGAVHGDAGGDTGHHPQSLNAGSDYEQHVSHRPTQSLSSNDSQPPMIDLHDLIEEHDSKWILNLNVQFRDRSEREKFFVTYAERPNLWRRLVIVWDCRHMRESCLERDLKSMVLQRDKSIRLFQSLRTSLQEVQYFDTVTRLTLRTEEDNQLHIYVSEDLRERTIYPSIRLVAHIDCPRYFEHEVDLVGHFSGYVYRVNVGGRDLVRKDLGGQHGMEGFLYELNALNALKHCIGIAQLQGVITDNSGEMVKGFLITCGSQGALGDLVYDTRRSTELKWPRRRKWARQILGALAEIHEAGYVQGDFTLSNIVIDNEDNANVVDFDRSGCPVGWEPPELIETINSRQRVRLMIGIKSDLFQLGMCLYALAARDPEPDRALQRGYDLRLMADIDVPDWYKDIVSICLSPRPQDRIAAMDLLRRFDYSLASELGRQARVPSVAAMSSVPFSSDGPRSDAERSSALGMNIHRESQALSVKSTRSSCREPNKVSLDSAANHKGADGPREQSEEHDAEIDKRAYLRRVPQPSRTSGSRISYMHGDHLLQDWNFDAVDPVLVPLSSEQTQDSLFDEALIQFVDDADRYIIPHRPV